MLAQTHTHTRTLVPIVSLTHTHTVASHGSSKLSENTRREYVIDFTVHRVHSFSMSLTVNGCDYENGSRPFSFSSFSQCSSFLCVNWFFLSSKIRIIGCNFLTTKWNWKNCKGQRTDTVTFRNWIEWKGKLQRKTYSEINTTAQSASKSNTNKELNLYNCFVYFWKA